MEGWCLPLILKCFNFDCFSRDYYNQDIECKKSNKHERDRKSVNLCIDKDERKRNNIDEIKNKIVSSLGENNPTIKCEEVGNTEEQQIKEDEKKVEKTIAKISSRYSIELAKKIAVEEENLQRAESIPPRYTY